MTQHSNSTSDPGYVVGINTEAAFSIFYEDAGGKLIFSIEVDDRPKTIYLNPRPSQDGRMVDTHEKATMARVTQAIARVKAYFEGQGLTVEID